jgi:hypothetical protein
MKVSIDKELEKVAQKEKERLNIDPVNEVKLLLAHDSQEDVRILRGLSKNSHFNRVEKVRGQQIELENLEKEYEGSIYNIEQIKQLCVDYRLRFLQSKHYTGSYDVEVSAKIKDFAKATRTSLDDHTLGSQFFIMAPPEMFELKDEKYISKAELRRQLDPAIFYQIDKTHFRLIHKWGEDFTVFRLLSGLRWKSWWSHQWFNTVMVAPIITFLFFICFDEPAAQFDNHPILNFLCIGLISFIVTYLGFGIWKQDEGSAIDGYFGKTNWDSTSKISR